MLRSLARGAVAGAAGTTALNAATYLDMALRGRPASETPERAVETMAERLGLRVPGDGSQRANRLTGVGALLGIVTGVGTGIAAGLCRPLVRRTPGAAAALVIGAAAMAGSDVSMIRLGVTDPADWSTADWLSDALPHLAYGAVAAALLR